MTEEATSIYVDKFYEMDPAFDDLLPSGADLRDGMIVLLEDSMIRVDLQTVRDNRYEMDRLKEANRWCIVSSVTVTRRHNYGELGQVVGEGSPLVSFIAEYPDGTKRKRSYDSSYAWLVKRDSLGGAA